MILPRESEVVNTGLAYQFDARQEEAFERLQDRRSLVCQLRVATVVLIVLLCLFRPAIKETSLTARLAKDAQASGYGSVRASLALRFRSEPSVVAAGAENRSDTWAGTWAAAVDAIAPQRASQTCVAHLNLAVLPDVQSEVPIVNASWAWLDTHQVQAVATP